MNSNDNLDKMIKEEQRILDCLIKQMDDEMLKLDDRLTRIIHEAKKAKEKCLPDTYGVMVQAVDDRIRTKDRIKDVQKMRDELYDHRIIVKAEDSTGSNDEIDLKIGLHTYAHSGNIFVCSWKRPICRHYLLDNTAETFESVVEGKHGEKYNTRYHLKLKRKIDLRFTKVRNVIHLFPMTSNETEDIIADEFLQELLERRSGQEFKNIVFSIQKQQGDIIQTSFKRDIIVQGCAGSGKSMIMLHRLPILLYDNPNSLERNNLYIITPSLAYIQMAENMRHQLEIEDLNMGTLEQYYDYLIQKFGRNPEEYGKINYGIKLSSQQEKYIYSEDCIKDICNEIEVAIKLGETDYTQGLELFVLEKKTETSKLPQARIIANILTGQGIINKNVESLRSYFRVIRDTLTNIYNLREMLLNRKQLVLREINRLITVEEKKIIASRKKLEKLNEEANEIAWANKQLAIKKSQLNIVDLTAEKEGVECNDCYFNKLNEFVEELNEVLRDYKNIKLNYEENTWQDIYKFISKRDTFAEWFEKFSGNIFEIKDLYTEYTDGILDKVSSILNQVGKLQLINIPLLKSEYYKKILETTSYYTKLKENLPMKIYSAFIKKIVQDTDNNDEFSALSCSPYLYVQILYLYQGVPNASRESLITIDEAQGLAPQEISLVKKINNNQVILNLFGDEKQHIEGTKGIDNWSEIASFADFEQFNMLENYRNARQITEYCNRRFNMKMAAINLDGGGVHELNQAKDFTEEMRRIFLGVQNKGLCAIVVKDNIEARYVLGEFSVYKHKIHDMTDGNYEIHHTRWNLMTVDQVKGLEFGTVIAVTGRMTQNEKYITYTRALDELYVFDKEVSLPDWAMKVDNDEKAEVFKSTNKKQSDRKKSQPTMITEISETTDCSKSLVKEYFENAGLKVIDMRSKGGFLWIVGDKEQIGKSVDEATDKFGISGGYSAGKATGFRPGWYTKTKK